jgi:predicted nucleic acid-binding protein
MPPRRFKVHHYRKLKVHLIQAAELSGSTVLYAEDLASRQKYGSVRVVNPFVTSAAFSGTRCEGSPVMGVFR